MTNTTAAVAKAAGTPVRGCACDCHLAVNGKSLFRQGHDAKLVSRLVRDTIDGDAEIFVIPDADPVDGRNDIQEVINQVTAVLDNLSNRLADKYHNAAMNAWAKAVNKKAPKAAKADVDADAVVATGEVKVGRWTYPTQTLGNGLTYRNERRDGAGNWTEVGV